jgi:hypothetical protein
VIKFKLAILVFRSASLEGKLFDKAIRKALTIRAPVHYNYKTSVARLSRKSLFVIEAQSFFTVRGR